MNSWRHFFLLLFFLMIANVFAFPVSGEEAGFRRFRENVLKQIEEVKVVIEKDPSDAKAHFKLGLSYMALGRHEEEIVAYLEAVRLEPDFAEAHFNLGLTYDLLANGDLAIRHMLRARQIYSAHRNHRGIRSSQRYLRTFDRKYSLPSKDWGRGK